MKGSSEGKEEKGKKILLTEMSKLIFITRIKGFSFLLGNCQNFIDYFLLKLKRSEIISLG